MRELLPLDNPARSHRVLAGQLDLLALAGSRVAQAVEAIAPSSLVARALAAPAYAPPAPRRAIFSDTAWPPPPAQYEPLPTFTPAPPPPPAPRPAPPPAPKPVAPPAPAPGPKPAQAVSTETPGLESYVARLLDPSKKAFAERLLPWLRGGSVGEMPGTAGIRGMNPAKALEVQRRMETMIAVSKPRAKTPAPAPVTARPAPKPAPAAAPPEPAPAPKRALAIVPPPPPSSEPAPVRKAPAAPPKLRAVRTSPLTPKPEPLDLSGYDTDEDRGDRVVRAFPMSSLGDARIARTGKDYGGRRVDDASVVLAREKLLQDCADAAEAVKTVTLTPAQREKATAGQARCADLRAEPFPWYGQRGVASKAMTEAWKEGRLYFDVDAWQWRAGNVAGSNAALVLKAASARQPYPLSTRAELEAEIQAWDDSRAALHSVSREEHPKTDPAVAARGLLLAARLNALGAPRAETSFAWQDPRGRENSSLRIHLHRASLVDEAALRTAFERARADAKSEAFYTTEPSAKTYQHHDKEPGRTYTVLDAEFPRYSGRVNAGGHHEQGAGTDATFLRALGAALVRRLRELGFAADPARDETPEAPAVSVRDTPEPNEKYLRWPGRDRGAVTAVLGAKAVGLWSKDRAALVRAAEGLREKWEYSTYAPVSEPVKVASGGYRVDARPSTPRQISRVLWVDPAMAVQVMPEALAASDELARDLRAQLETREELHRLEQGPYESERKRTGTRDPYLLDVWMQKTRERVLTLVPAVLGQFAQYKAFDPSLDRGALSHLFTLARSPARPWKGLRAGSKAAAAVGAAIDAGTLVHPDQSKEWVFTQGKGKTAIVSRGPTAWEAFKAGGGLSES